MDAIDPKAVIAWLEQALAEPWDGHCRHLVTLNPEYVMAARNDPAFGDALRAADLTTADGVGIVVAARLVHGTKLERVTGVEIVEALAAMSAHAAAPIYLLGAGPGVATAAADRLAARFPGALIAGAYGDASPLARDDVETLRRIAASGARVVLVAYGAPGQITWIVRNQAALAAMGIRLAIGVGGSFDYLSERAKRPPRIVRAAGLEWAYRLVREPWRWRRQLVLPVFAWLVALDAMRSHVRNGRGR